LKSKTKRVLVGTVRIKSKDLTVWEKTRHSWRRIKRDFPEALQVVRLFKAHHRFNMLVDKKDPRFLKGHLSPDGVPQGARINILPDGRVLNKAYSLLAPHLTIHDQTSHDHWDILYQNKGGTYSYVYTKGKVEVNRGRKYKEVDRFAKLHPTICRRVTEALHDVRDYMALPMYTLLHTYMRIGCEMYYRAHHHKGLTTLKSRDIKVKGDSVSFNYLAKDGVPCMITQRFPQTYVDRLRRLLATKRSGDFVFTKPGSRHPLAELEFKRAFKRYCGREFYPHIIRSYYATEEAKRFLMKHHKATKEQVNRLFTHLAETLGHKKYVKKKHMWKDNYTVTVNSYIQPSLAKRLKALPS